MDASNIHVGLSAHHQRHWLYVEPADLHLRSRRNPHRLKARHGAVSSKCACCGRCRLGDLDWFIGPPIEFSMAKLMPDAAQTKRDAVVHAYRECYDISGWSENALYPGIEAVLAALHLQGNRLFVCTSKREKFAVRVVQAFGLDPYFEAIYADRGDRPHSKSELLRELIQGRNLDPSQSVMVGDRRFDVEAAHENNLQAIAVTYGYGARQELEVCGPDALVERPSEIPAAVFRLLG